MSLVLPLILRCLENYIQLLLNPFFKFRISKEIGLLTDDFGRRWYLLLDTIAFIEQTLLASVVEERDTSKVSKKWSLLHGALLQTNIVALSLSLSFFLSSL